MTVNKDLTFEFRDEYNRKPIAKKLIRLLESDVDISPLVIDGGWGTGKSEFCHKLVNLLEGDENSNLSSVYIDAFKADHADEPLMTLLASILKLLPEADQITLTQKALPAIRFGAKTVLKSAASWVLKQEATDIADDFEGVLQDAGDDVINHSIESILKDHVKADESIGALRDALTELAIEKPIVIFVDELDRCRPNFAISMLESIKHIFDVEGVQFVLVVNTNQLKASVNHCYGISVDSQKYLDKFIGYKFPISDVIDINAQEKAYVSQQHFLTLIEESNLLQDSILAEINNASSFFTREILRINSISLREVETFVRYLEIYHELTDKKGLASNVIFGFSLLRILSVYLYCFNPDFIKRNNNGLEYERILNILGNNDMPKIDDDRHPSYIDVISARIGLDSGINVSDDDKKWWDEVMSGYFNRRIYQTQEDFVSSIVFSVSDVLDLK